MKIVNTEVQPDVVPLQISGGIDTDLTDLTMNEMMQWGLENLSPDIQESRYLVRHGRPAVSDFGRPRYGQPGLADRDNLFEKAFPCLYPYGTGGIEADQPVKIEFAEHVRWSLQHSDRRFRKHEIFPFLVFGILQRRQALLTARIQMRQKNFERDARIMSSITLDRLSKARAEEESGLPISDPGIQLLKKHAYSGLGRVMGSDQARYQLRSQIWSTAITKGPPSLWITINPSDIHDPIAQVFAGENIDLDSFMSTMGPDKDQRARNIAADPYAAAKFFHFMVRVIFETLFQVKVRQYKVKSGKGVLGRISAYFGTVESQGRGTLHLHLLVWLWHTPNADELTDLLKSERFRARMVAYIRANIRAYVPGLESAESIKEIPKDSEIAYSRPPHPDLPDYEDNLNDFERRLARTEQVHMCQLRRCLVPDKHGTFTCKRKAPFKFAADDFVTETGDWGPKRLFPYVNGWLPGILVNARCNNDVKLLTNGGDTKNITFYVTSYAAKKQGKIYNLSAILAQTYAYHHDRNNLHPYENLREDQRVLIFRLIHAINREQELAAPMVMSYLMGWGDVYRSHHYTPIFWSSFVGDLYKAFPDLRKRYMYAVYLM
jgi:hypothetical protein